MSRVNLGRRGAWPTASDEWVERPAQRNGFAQRLVLLVMLAATGAAIAALALVVLH